MSTMTQQFNRNHKVEPYFWDLVHFHTYTLFTLVWIGGRVCKTVAFSYSLVSIHRENFKWIESEPKCITTNHVRTFSLLIG